PTVHYNLGAALRARGRLDDAISEYRESLRLESDAPLAHYNLGLALDAVGRQQEAKKHYEESIRLEPGASLAHVATASLLETEGRWEDAIFQYQEAIRVDPQPSAMAHYQFGIGLWTHGRPDQAVGHFEQSLMLDSSSVSAREDLCKCRYAAASAALHS